MTSLSTFSMELRRAWCRLARGLARARGRSPNPMMADFIAIYERIWRDAAERISADFSEIQKGLWRIAYNGRATCVNNYKVQIDDPVVLGMAGDKPLCYRLLLADGIPVPDHECFRYRDHARAVRFMRRFDGGFFVVKPAAGTAGSCGVTTHIATPRECRQAIALASLLSEEILIERLVPGECYRVLVLDGKVLHASRRRGIRVTGDGRATVAELLGRIRGGAEDRDAQATLTAQGMTLDSVPRKGREVLARSFDNERPVREEICTFYDEDVTGLIAPGLGDTAVRAAGALKARFAGIDIITVDPTVPLGESGGAVNEVNTTPGLHNHYGLLNSGDASPAVDVLRYLFGIPDARSAARGSTISAGQEDAQ